MTYRLAAIHALQTTDRRHIVPKALLYQSAKMNAKQISTGCDAQ